MNTTDNESISMPENNTTKKIIRGAMQVAGGAIPIAGGLLSLIASTWSEKEQEKANKFMHAWIKMIEDELREKEMTLKEIIERLDMQDEKIINRIQSKEYQSLFNKAFREWSGTESENKRQLISNILTNAASTNISSDEVIKLFIEWLAKYSELHFQVIGAIYNSQGISRGGIWRKLNKPVMREDSADADMYKLLIRDLSTGGIIRQHRSTDYQGKFIKKPSIKKKSTKGSQFTSAFDEEDLYELTALGQQFIHYAMTDLTSKIEHKEPNN